MLSVWFWAESGWCAEIRGVLLVLLRLKRVVVAVYCSSSQPQPENLHLVKVALQLLDSRYLCRNFSDYNQKGYFLMIRKCNCRMCLEEGLSSGGSDL
jgi:hypothetical protein